MEVSSDVKTLLCKYYYFGHWPFYRFQYSTLSRVSFSLVFLWYLFTRHRVQIMEKMRCRGLNVSLTWSLFLLPVQVGCYFLASASRMKHTKSTQCLELSRRTGEADKKKKDKGRSEILMFSLHWNRIYSVKISKHWQPRSCLQDELHVEVYFPMDIKSLPEMNARS